MTYSPFLASSTHTGFHGAMIQLPGHSTSTPTAVPALYSMHKGMMPLKNGSGYTVNHLSYAATREKLASQAYAQHAAHVIVVEVRLVHMPVGKIKHQLIGVRHFNFTLSS